jgi:hypothetical protein
VVYEGHGLLKKSLFDFVYAINLKHKPWSSMPNGRPMVNAIFPAWEVLCCDEKCLRRTLVMKNMSIFLFIYFFVGLFIYFGIKIKFSK